MEYRIWRQDDNGNVFLVAVFPKRKEAEERLAQLTRMLHKQMYWIDDRDATAADHTGEE